MDFGFLLPTRGPLANERDIRAVVTKGEDLGYEYLLFNDHIVIPRTVDSRYPYSESGKFAAGPEDAFFEPLSLMAFVAGFSRSARLLTSVMVVPHRPAVFTAKALAGIDVLSGGRVTVGCGAGWMKEEFEAIDAPPFEARGRVTDEYIEAFKVLWTEKAPRFDGTYVKFADIGFEPKPVQKPHPPIWIGGESMPALRRVVRLGNAWYPIGANPRHPLDTVARYRARLDQLKALAGEQGRDPVSIDLAYWANWSTEDTSRKTDAGERHILTGSAEDIVADIGGLKEAGVRHLMLNFLRPTLGETVEAMERFASDIRPKVT